jgi:hypothetical protein
MIASKFKKELRVLPFRISSAIKNIARKILSKIFCILLSMLKIIVQNEQSLDRPPQIHFTLYLNL